MKRIIFFGMLFLGLAFAVQAQPGKPNNQGKNYSVGELDKLGKLELTRIYVDQVNKLTLLLPYVPFNQKGDAISLSGMGIPNTKDNNDAIKSLDNSGGNHNETLNETLNNIIPYADKADIIQSILFLQGFLDKIEAGI